MKLILYILAFVEGALVMSFELLTARLLSPIFGSSLYILTSVLGITMLSLLLGYYIGGRIVLRSKDYVFPFLIVSSVLLFALPKVCELIQELGLKTGLISESIINCSLLLGIPLIFLGAVSPQLIERLNQKNFKAGTAAGNIYAISTLGGVISTFFVGLVFIPNYGSSITAQGIGVVSLVIFLIFLFITSREALLKNLILYIFLFVMAISFNSFSYSDESNPYVIQLESSEGLLGKLEVFDSGNRFRTLSNNKTDQSIINLETNESIFHYTHVISTLASLKPPEQRSSACLIGLAGGSLIHELKHLNYKRIVGIDIDSRTSYLAEKYFGVDPDSYKFIEDDGRHFLKNSHEKFDVIIIDVSNSEEQPFHLYTKEAFDVYFESLSKNGFLILNILDFTDNRNVVITNKIGNSLVRSGFDVRLLKDFYPPNTLNSSNMEFYAHEKIILATKSNTEYNWYNNNQDELRGCCFKYNYNHNLKNNLSNMSFLKNSVTGEIYSDDIPVMEIESYKRSELLRSKFLNRK